MKIDRAQLSKIINEEIAKTIIVESDDEFDDFIDSPLPLMQVTKEEVIYFIASVWGEHWDKDNIDDIFLHGFKGLMQMDDAELLETLAAEPTIMFAEDEDEIEELAGYTFPTKFTSDSIEIPAWLGIKVKGE